VPDIDLFNFFRYGLAWVVTIYASIITVQSLWGWYVWLAGADRYMGILRRYLIVHGLRLRFGTFWGDAIISVLLCVVFFMLWHAHLLIYDLGQTYKAQRVAAAHELVLADKIQSTTTTSLHERHGIEQR